jgi:signal transduction histidine kinase
VDVEAAEALGEKAQAALYQIIREALSASIRRGPTRISIAVARQAEGSLEATIVDDALVERRRATFDSLAERARTLNARFDVEHSDDRGTTVRVSLPPYAAE